MKVFKGPAWAMKFAEFVDVFEVHKNKFQAAMDIYTANAVTGIQQLNYQMNLKCVVLGLPSL